jgi:hypothetical protein
MNLCTIVPNQDIPKFSGKFLHLNGIPPLPCNAKHNFIAVKEVWVWHYGMEMFSICFKLKYMNTVMYM